LKRTKKNKTKETGLLPNDIGNSPH